MTIRHLTPEEKQTRQDEINVRVNGMLQHVVTIEWLIKMFKKELSQPIPDVNRAGYIALLERVSNEFVAEYRDVIPINLTINPFDVSEVGGNPYSYDYGSRAAELGIALGTPNPRANPNYDLSIENKYHDSHDTDEWWLEKRRKLSDKH
jgi:hypothetical protein